MQYKYKLKNMCKYNIQLPVFYISVYIIVIDTSQSNLVDDYWMYEKYMNIQKLVVKVPPNLHRHTIISTDKIK